MNPTFHPKMGFVRFKGGFLTLGSCFFQAFPSSFQKTVASLKVVTDYSSGGCVRISRTSLHLKPYSQLSKKFQPIITFSPSQEKKDKKKRPPIQMNEMGSLRGWIKRLGDLWLILQ
jgi:hypothetical protein